MTDNPLDDTSPAFQERIRIRIRAYHLWEADGRPDGHEQEYWERAETLIGMEDNPETGTIPNPMAAGQDPGAVVVEEASLQENLGEFPGLFTDQGDAMQSPMGKDPSSEPQADAPPAPAKPAPAKPAPAKSKARAKA